MALARLHPPNEVDLCRPGDVATEAPLKPATGADADDDEIVVGEIHGVGVGQVEKELVGREVADALERPQPVEHVGHEFGFAEAIW